MEMSDRVNDDFCEYDRQVLHPSEQSCCLTAEGGLDPDEWTPHKSECSQWQ